MAELCRYKAFISYSRQDREVARRLQRELESYVLPKAVEIAGVDRRQLKRPLKPVFRDESELVPGQDLPERIRQGLAQSESLVVICSPAAARSEWVEKEIVDFTKLGKGRRVLAVVVGGKPNAPAHGLAAEHEALPSALRFRVNNDGTISNKPADPLWIDYRENIVDRREMFLRLVAALLDVKSFDELILRERQAERRRRLVAQGIAAGMTVLAILASGAGKIAYDQRGQALDSREETLRAQGRLLTLYAAERLKDGDLSSAQSIIVEVLAHRESVREDRAAAVSVFQDVRSEDRQLAVVGHSSVVNAASWSPDGKRIVTACHDGTARIWDAATGAELVVLRGHRGAVDWAAFSPDGRRIITASDDNTARIWDAVTGMQLVVLSGHSDEVQSAVFSPDGNRIVTASSDRTARIWDASTAAELVRFTAHNGVVKFANWSPDGRRIVTVSNDTTARIWNAASGAQVAVFTGHGGYIDYAEFSPDGRRLACLAYDGHARIWDVATGAMLAAVSTGDSKLNSVAFSHDGRRIVTASTDKTARIWDAATGAQLTVLYGHNDFVYSAQFAPDGRRVLTASHDKTARVWDATTGAQLAVLSPNVPGEPVYNSWSAGFSPNGRRVVMGSGGKALIWDVDGRVQLTMLPHTNLVRSAAFSPDGRRVLTASDDRTAHIWDAATGAELRKLSGHNAQVLCARFSPDGRRIVTASADNTARLWDAATGVLRAVLHGHTDMVMTAAFSPDGRRIVTASRDKTARIWDASSSAQLVVLMGHGDIVESAAFSPNGRLIVTASRDKTARVWDAATGVQLAVLYGHGDQVMWAAFSSDGRRIATASRDNTVRLWDTATGAQLAAYGVPALAFHTAEFSPDGQRVVTSSGDGNARIWDARVPAKLEGQIVWQQAAEIDGASEVERAQLGLLSDPGASRRPNDISKCDAVAAAPYDPNRSAPGVPQDEVATDVAVSACSKSASSDSPRFVYQLGRALMAKRDFRSAARKFEQAVSADYRAARVDLANMLVDSSAGMLDPARAVSLYEQAWQDGVPIAAFELGHLDEQGAPGDAGNSHSALQPDLAKAWFWYRKGANAGEPNALARLGEEDDRAAAATKDKKKREAILLQAFRHYAAAAERAHDQDWPDDAWKSWRYRRATLARLLAREGMMQQVADSYTAVRQQWQPPQQTFIEHLRSWLP